MRKRTPPIDVDVIAGFPPNAEEIWNELRFDPTSTVFAHEGSIYAPTGDLTPWLIEHEKVHFRQQDDWPGGCDQWWEDYLDFPEMRFAMEAEAHQREYDVFCEYHLDRNDRYRYKFSMAKRLMSPMYGGEIGFLNAMHLLERNRKRTSNEVMAMTEIREDSLVSKKDENLDMEVKRVD